MSNGYEVNSLDLDTLLLRRDFFNYGNLLGWGLNGSSGTLGNGTTSNLSAPRLTATANTNWIQISSYGGGSSGLTSDGNWYVWGSLGGAVALIPTQMYTGTSDRFIQVLGGGSDFLAIKTDNTLWGFGTNTLGQLGDNSTSSRPRETPVQVAGGGQWKQISGGIYNFIGLRTNATAWCWGTNAYGQLGNNTTTDRSSPVSVVGGLNFAQVSAGTYFAGGITTTGRIYMWGANYYGQLGDGTTIDRGSPVQIAGGGSNWKYLSAGDESAAAVKEDGTLWTWGGNSYGQLGDGTLTNKSSPVTVAGGGTTWKNVSVKSYSTMAFKSDGSLWAWGYNNFGQLGDGTTSTRSSPISILGGSNSVSWKSVDMSVSAFAIQDNTSGDPPVVTGIRTSVALAINSDTYSYDVYSNAIAAPNYVAGFTDIAVTVGPGVYVGDGFPSATGYAMVVPTSFNPGDAVTITNFGYIWGTGGSGGSGTNNGVGSNGTPGSTAILAQRPTTVINNFGGYIAGGGGGGGGGSGIQLPSGGKGFNDYLGGGGGGAGGRLSGYGGNPGGSAGFNGFPGAGGAGGPGIFTPAGVTTAAGGPGGNIGQNGSPAFNPRPSPFSPPDTGPGPGSGGTAGYYIDALNPANPSTPYITLVNFGQVLGPTR